jgi:hypothetical protein
MEQLNVVSDRPENETLALVLLSSDGGPLTIVGAGAQAN